MQQLKHDVFYIIYNRKYRLLILLTILLTAGLTIYTAVNVKIEEDILIHSFENFRQFFWLLCAYLIADLLSTDYHSQTFKNIIPKSSNRSDYYLSKIMTATNIRRIYFIDTCYNKLDSNRFGCSRNGIKLLQHLLSFLGSFSFSFPIFSSIVFCHYPFWKRNSHYWHGTRTCTPANISRRF